MTATKSRADGCRGSHDQDHGRQRHRHALLPAGRPERRFLRCPGALRRADAPGPHPPRAGDRLHGPRRGAGDRQAAGLLRRAGAGFPQHDHAARHRPVARRAGARRFRPDLRAVHRQGHRLPARDPRPARDHADADQMGGPHRRTAGCSGQEPHGIRGAAERRPRPRRPRMRLEHVEALGRGRLRRHAGRAPHAAPSTSTRSRRRRNCSPAPSGRSSSSAAAPRAPAPSSRASSTASRRPSSPTAPARAPSTGAIPSAIAFRPATRCGRTSTSSSASARASSTRSTGASTTR